MRFFFGIVLLLAIITAPGCGKSDKPGKKEPSGVERFIIAKSGLRMREKPDLTGKKILTIPHGKTVKLLEETGEAIKISGVTGRWSKVRWKGKTGWVFGGFLGSSITDKPGKRLPQGLLGTYLLKEEMAPGNMPSRIHLDNAIITKAVGGDIDSSEYCIVRDVARKGKVFNVKCSRRKLTDEELRVFQVDRSAADLKRIVVTDRGKGRISVGKSIYIKRKG